MPTARLTMDVWLRLVAENWLEAYRSQWAEHTDAELAYAGRRIIEAGWTVPEATWTVRECVMHYSRLQGPLAMLTQTHDGRTGFDGNTVGGWRQSREYARIGQRYHNRMASEQCGQPDCDGTVRHYEMCVECKRFKGATERRDGGKGGFVEPVLRVSL